MIRQVIYFNAAIHEALEQQSISVAKAGLVCKLNTRCSVIAAVNPKGHYDSSQSIEVNTALASPLLSRFDLIIPILDTKDKEWDTKVADCILNRELDCLSMDECLFTFDHIRAYISWSKGKFSPQISAEANSILKTYYRYQRSKDQRHSVRVTVRLLESLIRLAEAHARLTAKRIVGIDDAVAAVYIIETSLLTTSLIGVPSSLHTNFPDDPERDFSSMSELN